MRRSEPDSHVGVDARHLVEQIGKAQTSLLGSVDGVEAAAELRQLWATELLL